MAHANGLSPLEEGSANGILPEPAMGAVIAAIVRGHSVRETVRLTGVRRDQVNAIVVQVGNSCSQHHAKVARDLGDGTLRCSVTKLLQEKSLGPMRDRARLSAVGTAWTWACIDPSTGFVLSWLVAPRNAEIARIFLAQVITSGRTQIQIANSDGRILQVHRNRDGELSIDPNVLVRIFGTGTDYLDAVGALPDDPRPADRMIGIADPWLNILSPGLSRKVQRNAAVLALLFTLHNFATAELVTSASPAMLAGISDHVWTVAEIVRLVNTALTSPTLKPGPASSDRRRLLTQIVRMPYIDSAVGLPRK
jgi:hypothetical protein